jgi:hypothetical protein
MHYKKHRQTVPATTKTPVVSLLALNNLAHEFSKIVALQTADIPSPLSDVHDNGEEPLFDQHALSGDRFRAADRRRGLAPRGDGLDKGGLAGVCTLNLRRSRILLGGGRGLLRGGQRFLCRCFGRSRFASVLVLSVILVVGFHCCRRFFAR